MVGIRTKKVADAELNYLCQILNLDIWPNLKEDNKIKPFTRLNNIGYLGLKNPTKEKEDRTFMTSYLDEDDKAIFNGVRSDGLEFVHGSDAAHLFKNMYDVEHTMLKNCGFYGAMYYKKEANEIVFIFRSTDPSDIADVVTDINIGLFKIIDLQLLCASTFVDYCIKEFVSLNVEIYVDHMTFTGHSLGGALAQYAYMTNHTKYSKMTSRCITFNNLGIAPDKKVTVDDIIDNTEIFSPCKQFILYEIKHKYGYERTHLPEPESEKWHRNLMNMSIKSLPERNIEEISYIIEKNLYNYEYSNEFTPLFSKEVNIFGGIKIQFGTLPSKTHSEREEEKVAVNKSYIPIDKDFVQTISTIIYRSIIDSINIDTERKYTPSEVISYVNPEDWTPKIQKQLGYICNIHSGEIKLDNITSSLATVLNSIKKFGFKHHGLNQFIEYLDQDTCDLRPGIKQRDIPEVLK